MVAPVYGTDDASDEIVVDERLAETVLPASRPQILLTPPTSVLLPSTKHAQAKQADRGAATEIRQTRQSVVQQAAKCLPHSEEVKRIDSNDSPVKKQIKVRGLLALPDYAFET